MWLPDKGRAIKGLVVCNCWDLEPLAKRSGPRLLSTVPWGMTHICGWQTQIFFLDTKNPLYLAYFTLSVLSQFIKMTYYNISLFTLLPTLSHFFPILSRSSASLFILKLFFFCKKTFLLSFFFFKFFLLYVFLILQIIFYYQQSYSIKAIVYMSCTFRGNRDFLGP